MYLTGIIDVCYYSLSVGVLRFAFHLDDFNGVADFNVVYKSSLDCFDLSFVFIVGVSIIPKKFYNIGNFKATNKVFRVLSDDD